MRIESALTKLVVSFALFATPALARSNHAGKNAHRNPAHSHAKKHYFFHHDHRHINDPKHPKSPKWHPTNPHHGNFAD